MRLRNAKLQRRSSASEEGFTLLETAVALVVMMIVGVGVASAFVYAVSSNTGASDRTAALAVAQKAIERLRAADFVDASLTSTATSGPRTENVSVNGHSYQITTTVVDTVVSGKITLKKITVQVTPKNNNRLSSLSSGSTTSGAFGSVMLVTERCSPVVGANLQ